MGVGDALSTKSENEYILMEKAREKWELDNHPEGEVEEMIDLYVNKGMSKEDATQVIHRMAKYPEFFVNVMMAEELELQVPDDDDNPWIDGAVTFGSFVFFGTIPLLGYLCFHGIKCNFQFVYLHFVCFFMATNMRFQSTCSSTAFSTPLALPSCIVFLMHAFNMPFQCFSRA